MTIPTLLPAPSGDTYARDPVRACMQQHIFLPIDAMLHARDIQHKRKARGRPVVPLKVLILASGPGIEVDLLTDRYSPSQISILATDVAQAMLDATQRIADAKGKGCMVQTRLMDACELRLADASVDVVLMLLGPMTLLERDAERSIREVRRIEVRRVLRPAGLLAFCTPGELDQYTLLDVARRDIVEARPGTSEDRWKGILFRSFYHHPAMKSWGDLQHVVETVQDAGFEDVRGNVVQATSGIRQGEEMESFLTFVTSDAGMTKAFQGTFSDAEKFNFTRRVRQLIKTRWPGDADIQLKYTVNIVLARAPSPIPPSAPSRTSSLERHARRTASNASSTTLVNPSSSATSRSDAPPRCVLEKYSTFNLPIMVTAAPPFKKPSVLAQQLIAGTPAFAAAAKLASASGDAYTRRPVRVCMEEHLFGRIDALLAARASKKHPLTLLVLASGTGNEVDALTDRYEPSQLSILATDAVQGMVDATQRLVEAKEKQTMVQTRVMNACDIQLADASVDVVTLFFTAMALSDADAARSFREVRRVLRPGGLCAYTTPHELDQYTLLDKAKRDVVQARTLAPGADVESRWNGIAFRSFYDHPVMRKWGALQAVVDRVEGAHFKDVQGTVVVATNEIHKGDEMENYLGFITRSPGMVAIFQSTFSEAEKADFERRIRKLIMNRWPSDLVVQLKFAVNLVWGYA